VNAVTTPSQPQRDRFLGSEIHDKARRHMRWHELKPDEHAAAVAGGRRREQAERARAGQS